MSDADLSSNSPEPVRGQAGPDAREQLEVARNSAAERLAQLQSMIAGANDYAFISVDLEGRIIEWSNGAADTFGWSESEVAGELYDLIWTPEDRNAGRPAIELVIAKENGFAPDQRWHVRNDGRRIFVSGSTRPVRNATGRLTGFVKVCRDETDHQASAEALGRAAAIIDSSDDAIISKTLDGVIRTWNGAAERLFGYTAGEAIGRPITMLLPLDRQDEEPRILEQVRAGIRVDHFETVRVRKDLTLIDVSVTISPVRDASGKVTGASKIARDITGQKRAEASIRASKARLSNIVSHALDCIIGIDHRGVVTGWNPAAERTFGFTAGQAIGKALADLIIPPPLREQHRRGLAKYLVTGEGPVMNQRLELMAVRQDGTELPVELAVTATNSSAAEAEFTGFVRDISRQKMAEAAREELLIAERTARSEAEQQGRLKDEFLATLSHELRTPLNAIVGWVQILRAPTTAAEDLNEGLSVIYRNARAQTQIIEDILDMSRIVSGKLRLDVQRVDLTSIIRAGVESIQPSADAKGVRVQVLLDPAAGPVSGDPNRLHQVIWNLLGNAIKFTPKGGRVQVLLERVNSQVEISVIDTGEGIEGAFLPHVFDRFRQADGSTTRKHGGLGLGLAIVKQLVEAHGGLVHVTSPGVGKGATFIVSLPVTVVHSEHGDLDPVKEHPEAEVTLVGQQNACRQLNGVSVVAVDDEPDGRAVVKRLLEECGARVRTAGSAVEALRLLADEVPTVLISDIGMPAEDGYSLIRQVRALPVDRGGNVHAVALTAYARASDRIRSLEAGFEMHLAKPVEPVELIMTVAALAKRALQPHP